MATAAAAFAPATITGAVMNFDSKIPKRTNKVVDIVGMNPYGASNTHGRGGGALSSKCSDAGEIFRIDAIMNGLVLVGVAVGFVLLRTEAWVEENEWVYCLRCVSNHSFTRD
ncbi:uncharacterized protein LOC133690696 [Populus nigra]|uniref:uncharacterized protein LOC133690696 n=1 Tax=Populus nigra TaxID=3691 RepID=UPI002B268507|nr:uncharacterized protein LOC133690696 [Populus nigra]